MRRTLLSGSLAIRPSLVRIFAMVMTFTCHAVLLALLIHETRVQAPTSLREAIEIDLRDFEPMPVPLPPVRPQLDPIRKPAAPARAPAPAPVPIAAVSAPEPQPSDPQPVTEPPPATDLRARIEHQRRAVANDIARENAPRRRPFAGRSFDAMLPDGDNGKLPGFRPRTHDGMHGQMRALGRILSVGVPNAASDYHAPLDLLTEGWENKHHSSDMAQCDRDYARFDAQLRRQLCGFVRPPE